jgi:hypothetical protein
MLTVDDVRTLALALPDTSERSAPRCAHPQFMTNGKCFAALRDADASFDVWSGGGWTTRPLALTPEEDARSAVEQAWRQRAKKRSVASLDYAIGAEELKEVFADLRLWPELTETSPGWYEAGGRAFLHFHHSAAARHADIKEGLGWGTPVPLPLGRPAAAVKREFLAQARRRLDITIRVLGGGPTTRTAG